MSEPTEDDVRAEVRAWLKANWNPDSAWSSGASS